MYNEYNWRIHQYIWHGADNIKLEQLLLQLWHTMNIDSYARETALKSNAEHKQIIESLESGIWKPPIRPSRYMSTEATRALRNISTGSCDRHPADGPPYLHKKSPSPPIQPPAKGIFHLTIFLSTTQSPPPCSCAHASPPPCTSPESHPTCPSPPLWRSWISLASSRCAWITRL